MSNEKIAIGGVILLVIAVVASVTAVAIRGVIDGVAFQLSISNIAAPAIGGLIGYIGARLPEKIKHTKDIELGKVLDYHENSEEGV